MLTHVPSTNEVGQFRAHESTESKDPSTLQSHWIIQILVALHTSEQ